MKTVMKKLLSVMLVALLLVSAVPFRASADEVSTVDITIYEVVDNNATEYAVVKGVNVSAYASTQEMAEAIYDGGEFELIRYKDFGNGTAMLQLKPIETSEEVSTVDITIYEVIDNNATEYAVVKGVNASAYASVEAMVEAIYDGEYSSYKYKDFGDGTAMLQIWPIETPEGKEIAKLTLVYNNGTSDKVSFDVYVGDNILEAIEAYGVQLPAYEGHKFVGWSFSHTTNDASDADKVVNRYHVIEGDTTLWADYDVISDDDDDNDDVVYDAVLKIYINGTTSSAAKTIDMDAYSVDGKITRTEVEAAVKKYYKASNDNGLSFNGLFTSDTWNNGKYDVDDAVSTVTLDANKTTTIYVMVKNATAITTNTDKPVDSTNPQTGDAIVVALAVMMSTGGAALTLGKKKF